MPREREWVTYFSPRKTLVELGLKEGVIFADLGCGYGTFAIAAAKVVGKKGCVYAIDIDAMMLRVVAKRASEERMKNVVTILADISTWENRILPPVDFVLLANIIHGAKNKVRLLKAAADMLRPDGIIAVLNWKIEKTPRGPPVRMRPTMNETVEWLNKAGCVNPVAVEVPPYHYGVVTRLQGK